MSLLECYCHPWSVATSPTVEFTFIELSVYLNWGTSCHMDDASHPYLATYWSPEEVS